MPIIDNWGNSAGFHAARQDAQLPRLTVHWLSVTRATEGPLSEISGPYFSLAPAVERYRRVDSLDGPDLRREVVIETLMVENRNKSETAQRVAWGRRFLAATVVVPPSISELLNTDAMAVLAVIRNEAAATGKCALPVARIAERANVGRAKVRAAIKLAERLEIIAIEIAPDRRRVIINRCVTSRC